MREPTGQRHRYINFSIWETSYQVLQEIRHQARRTQVDLIDEAIRDLAAKLGVQLDPVAHAKEPQ